VKYLKDESSTGKYSEDVTESLEVAIQCLEQAFNVVASNTSTELDCGRSLLDIFTDVVKTPESGDAEQLKLKGNELMKDGSYQEAVDSYTKAIEIDPNNAIFFSNRAAAYTKLGRHEDAIHDCKTAVRLNPQFSRAYGRMGLAQMNKEQYEDARQSYKKALSLDPENSGYAQNLELVEQKIAEKKRSTTPPASGGLDLGSLLSNPAVMDMARNFMQSPQMQQMFSGLAGGLGQGGPSGNGGQNEGPSQPGVNMQDIFGQFQNAAQQLRQDNPELIEQFRSQFQGENPGEDSQKEK